VQPWHTLAAVYDRNGQPAGARRLRLTAANRVTKNSSWPTKLVRTTYLGLVGHGYYPLLAGAWLVLVVVAATILVAANRADFVPTDIDRANQATMHSAQQTHSPGDSLITAQTPCSTHPGYPCLNSLPYTVSMLVPTAGSTASDWTIRSNATHWLTIALPLLKLFAWVLTALWLAGITGLLRKT